MRHADETAVQTGMRSGLKIDRDGLRRTAMRFRIVYLPMIPVVITFIILFMVQGEASLGWRSSWWATAIRSHDGILFAIAANSVLLVALFYGFLAILQERKALRPLAGHAQVFAVVSVVLSLAGGLVSIDTSPLTGKAIMLVALTLFTSIAPLGLCIVAITTLERERCGGGR